MIFWWSKSSFMGSN